MSSLTGIATADRRLLVARSEAPYLTCRSSFETEQCVTSVLQVLEHVRSSDIFCTMSVFTDAFSQILSVLGINRKLEVFFFSLEYVPLLSQKKREGNERANHEPRRLSSLLPVCDNRYRLLAAPILMFVI